MYCYLSVALLLLILLIKDILCTAHRPPSAKNAPRPIPRGPNRCMNKYSGCVASERGFF